MAAFRKVEIGPLETERLILRPIRLSDAPRVQLIFPNPNVVRYLSAAIPWPYPENGALDALTRMVAAMETGDEFYWGIHLKDEERLMGLISLTPANEEANRGFWLGEPYWGQGFMQEASDRVTDFAFDVLEMEALLLNNAEPNLGSHRLKETAGAVMISVTEDDYVGGRFRSVRWRLTAEAWRTRPKPSPRGRGLGEGFQPEPILTEVP